MFFLRDGTGIHELAAGGNPAVHRVDTEDDRALPADDMSHGAFDRFFASVERDAYRLAMAAVHDEDDAIDIVQDAMMTLVKRYRENGENEWRPLFYRILQNQIRDWYRRRSVKHALLRWSCLGDTTEQIVNIRAPLADNPEHVTETDESLAAVEVAILQLPYRQQQVFLLRCWQEWSVADTARIMSISESSVKTHYARALSVLRDKLSDELLLNLQSAAAE